MNKFSERIKELRIERGLSRTELAKQLNTLMRTVAYWETGERECSFDTLIAIAEFFEVSVDYLLGVKDFF